MGLTYTPTVIFSLVFKYYHQIPFLYKKKKTKPQTSIEVEKFRYLGQRS